MGSLADPTLPFADLLGQVLHQTHGLDTAIWQRAKEAVETLWGEQIPVVCPLENGLYVWEIWHNGRYPASLYVQAYLALSTAPQEEIEAITYGVGLAAVYAALVKDGLKMGEKINVAAPLDSAAFVGCVWAQREGLPIYSVIGCDDERHIRRFAEEGKTDSPYWRLMRRLCEGKPWKKALPEVEIGSESREALLDVMATLYDEEGYLLHKESAKSIAIALDYIQDCEDEHPTVAIAPVHPMEDVATAYDVVFEHPAKDLAKAKEALELETGWELPDPLPTEKTVREEVRRLLGEPL